MQYDKWFLINTPVEPVERSDKVKTRGDDLENRTASYLNWAKKKGYIDDYFWAKRDNCNNGIDFIIYGPFGTLYMDAVAQGRNGSIIEKIVAKCMKYIFKYNCNHIYMLLPYCSLNSTVVRCLDRIEKTEECKIHKLDWLAFTEIIEGKVDPYTREPYVVGKDGVRETPPATVLLNKFFKFKNKK